MRLIDADALIKTLNEEKIKFNADVNYIILNAPTIEAEPIRHGKWIYKVFEKSRVGFFECSECGYVAFNEKSCHYCYNCGAKMDEEDTP